MKDLGKYLGAPILHHRVCKATYKDLVQKVQNRTTRWNPHRISLAGRLTLCQSVLAAMPNYIMQSAHLPIGICEEIDKLRRNFLWGAREFDGTLVNLNSRDDSTLLHSQN